MKSTWPVQSNVPPPSLSLTGQTRYRQRGGVSGKPWFLMQKREFMTKMVSSTRGRGCQVRVIDIGGVSTTRGVNDKGGTLIQKWIVFEVIIQQPGGGPPFSQFTTSCIP